MMVEGHTRYTRMPVFAATPGRFETDTLAVTEGLRFRVKGPGLGVVGVGLRVEGVGLRVEGVGLRVWG